MNQDYESPRQPSEYSSHQSSSAYSDQTVPTLATVAMVLGIVAMCLSPLLVFGIAALVCGIIALNQTGGPNNIPGRGRAVAGIALGGSSFFMIIIVALLIGILLPALGAARRTAQRMQNSTQLRGIHQGLVIHAQTNRNYFPGLDRNGVYLQDQTLTGNSGQGDTVEARFWIMLDGDFISPEYSISPSETEAIYEWSSGPATSSHYSYALLSIDNADLGSQDPPPLPRHTEWKETLNPQAVVISDRNLAPAGAPPTSIHTDDPTKWRGSVLWNDNHVGFEQDHYFATRYGNGSLNADARGLPTDSLFSEDTTNGRDALMIYEGD